MKNCTTMIIIIIYPQEDEKSPLLLKQCLSYDEMKLSALLSVSSWSYFINDGTRQNKGVAEKKTDSFTTRGVIIGLIGARLKRLGLMEWQEVLVTKVHNTKQNGYGPPTKSGSAKQGKCVDINTQTLLILILWDMFQMYVSFYSQITFKK